MLPAIRRVWLRRVGVAVRHCPGRSLVVPPHSFAFLHGCEEGYGAGFVVVELQHFLLMCVYVDCFPAAVVRDGSVVVGIAVDCDGVAGMPGAVSAAARSVCGRG